ncbi:NB-ARC domain-containing protein [Burkholderia sp. Bp8986]|uniref:NB-ARC domain-containing protein n=1 Tax=Burkholderia sp. Bp8986 TaxID=2184550 RepID=UPI000F5ABE74|nr:NB-ARC domain-containing protein [Burkholderia sp. Bp8986]RQS48086.1 hypothetical protein DID99_28630 [Burkholderia sp. Bp8986]
MTLEQITFHDADTLRDRLAYNITTKQKPIVFLLGAPASGSVGDVSGVPDVDGVVELVRAHFSDSPSSLSALERDLTQASTNAYQAAMTFLLGRRGQDAVNDVIRSAVIEARKDRAEVVRTLNAASSVDAALRSLERDVEQWNIPPALDALARLMKFSPVTLGNLHLTTNFDPLLSIAAEKQGVTTFRSVLARDGSLTQVQAGGAHIVHLHGFWHGVDTLHTPRQLSQSRPRLKSSLAQLLRGCIVVPIAYGGWDDVFTQTLVEVVQDDESRPEILWTFYGQHDADLLSRHSQTLELLGPGLDRGRIQLFKGIDCHTFLDRLADEIGAVDTAGMTMHQRIADAVSESISTVYDSITYVGRESTGGEVVQSDAIPSSFELVGRSDELRIIADDQTHIVSISGIGGQGKTSLAAAYALECKKQGRYDFVDWRDCREQGDTLQTIFIRIAHARLHKTVGLELLRDLSIEQLVDAIVKTLEQHNGILVLDNVDQYIDLESGDALGPLKILIDTANDRTLSGKIIITARPVLALSSSPTVFSIALRGLSKETTKLLFEQKSERQPSAMELGDLHTLTEGHPLWISLIAARCRQGLLSIGDILRDIESGRGDLPDRALSSNWRALNDKQKTVLRTLAELERPLPEEDVSQIDFDINYNQFTKALKALKALALVELKETDSGKPVLDLHPLIRQYVRKNFPRTEREKFIGKIIIVLDRQLTSFRKLFPNSLPTNALEVWTHKIDLSLNRGDVNAAIESLVEIEDPMIETGMGEELIRLSHRVFEMADWQHQCAASPKFSKLWSVAVKLMAELGMSDRAAALLERYESSIQGRGGQYVNLCNTRCYKLWFEGQFEEAMYWGEMGVTLKASTEADIVYDCQHNLALARRDHGRIDEAMQYFLEDMSEDMLLNSDHIDKHRNGSFYGNIGRCYHLSGKLDEALICYKKSAILLEDGSGSVTNRGYIRHWVGEALKDKGRLEEAGVFFRAAYEIWKGLVPRRANSIEDALEQLFDDHPSLQAIEKLPPWRLENRFLQWINA